MPYFEYKIAFEQNTTQNKVAESEGLIVQSTLLFLKESFEKFNENHEASLWQRNTY